MNPADFSASGNTLTFTWPHLDLQICLARLKETAQGCKAEWSVRRQVNGAYKEVTSLTSNLSSGTARDQLVKRMRTKWDGLEWDNLIEYVAVKAIKELRKGEPAQDLCGASELVGEAFVLNPLIYERHPSLLFGLGGTFKSFFVLYCGMLMAVGGQENGLLCCEQSVLYLDWELEAEDLDQRMTMLKRGHPSLAAAHLTYRRMTLPLSKTTETIRQTIADEGISVLLIDSLALAAAGSELERSEAAQSFYAALRELKRPALIVGHTPKAHEEGKPTSPYGSVFFFNLQRNAWEMRKVQEAEARTLLIGLYHQKSNFGPSRAPLGFSISFEEAGACRISTCDLSADPDLSHGLPAADRIAQLLSDGQARTCKTIACDLRLKEDSTRALLNRHKGRRWFRLSAPDGKGETWAALG